jgi:hypothetical protein
MALFPVDDKACRKSIIMFTYSNWCIICIPHIFQPKKCKHCRQENCNEKTSAEIYSGNDSLRHFLKKNLRVECALPPPQKKKNLKSWPILGSSRFKQNNYATVLVAAPQYTCLKIEHRPVSKSFCSNSDSLLTENKLGKMIKKLLGIGGSCRISSPFSWIK